MGIAEQLLDERRDQPVGTGHASRVGLTGGRVLNPHRPPLRLRFDLRPPAIEAADGLRWAVKEQLERMEETNRIVWTMDVEPGLEPGLETRLALFRIAQEGLRNVVRHAHATKVRVRFESRDGGVLATIGDDGTGSPPPTRCRPRGTSG